MWPGVAQQAGEVNQVTGLAEDRHALVITSECAMPASGEERCRYEDATAV